MTDLRVVVDTSVLLKWFYSDNELEVAESLLVHHAHRTGLLTAHILDLTLYELGNILLRKRHWPADEVADTLDDLLVICGPTLVPPPEWRRNATALSAEYGLSFYDASFVSAARALEAPLLSADKKLLDPGLAQSATQFVEEHGDHIRNTP
ncbi:type II toxin-antitoxin system VapC family toxin [Pseudonocardia acaciae]|uniref:type II toxin-antitoxin system VapC family toxin n=1 Tax=Pseudonocardia acaciae TaxID=551276 RepID=UPI00048DD00C|nr:type II toxin-antitoxin system VapC family toxin [Pseudonocardia acaciae]